MIGSHSVDGASNATASVNELEWTTRDERSGKIIAQGCNAHKIQLAMNDASGVSGKKNNLNAALGRTLNLLHETLVRLCASGARIDIFEEVQKEHGRKNLQELDFGVVTRWMSRHKEAKIASINQTDISNALERMLCDGGIDEDLVEEAESINDVKLSDYDWVTIAQYESGTLPLKQLSNWYQTKAVMFHMELFEIVMALQRLAAPFFCSV